MTLFEAIKKQITEISKSMNKSAELDLKALYDMDKEKLDLLIETLKTADINVEIKYKEDGKSIKQILFLNGKKSIENVGGIQVAIDALKKGKKVHRKDWKCSVVMDDGIPYFRYAGMWKVWKADWDDLNAEDYYVEGE